MTQAPGYPTPPPLPRRYPAPPPLPDAPARPIEALSTSTVALRVVVFVAAGLNMAYILIATAMLSSGTMLALFGLLLLPQPMLFVQMPLLAWGISALAFALAAGLAFIGRRRTGGAYFFRFFAIGTAILSATLLIGPLFYIGSSVLGAASI